MDHRLKVSAFEQSFNNSYTQLKTTAALKSGTKSAMVNYYNSAGYLYRTVDSSQESVSIYEYAYDSTGKTCFCSKYQSGHR
jgi:hypothetical protein